MTSDARSIIIAVHTGNTACSIWIFREHQLTCRSSAVSGAVRTLGCLARSSGGVIGLLQGVECSAWTAVLLAWSQLELAWSQLKLDLVHDLLYPAGLFKRVF